MRAKPGTGKSEWKRLTKPVVSSITRVLLGRYRIANKIDSLARQYSFDTSCTVAAIAYGYGPQERMVKRDFLPRVELQFEGHSFTGPSCYDTYLRALYGDYMTLPPEAARQAHTMQVYEILP